MWFLKDDNDNDTEFLKENIDLTTIISVWRPIDIKNKCRNNSIWMKVNSQEANEEIWSYKIMEY